MAPDEPVVPALPERYGDVTVLGRGGQAITVAAHDRRTDRAVAIKVLDLAAVKDWAAFERFERECTVLGSLEHPGIPAFLEHHRDDERGQVLLVMERVEGRTLAQDLASGRRRTEAQLLDLLRQLLDVLEYLHGLHPPVVHRDITPGNVIVRPDGRAVLVDFGGVTKVFHPKGASTVVGTFGYMAPEQLHGQVTPACDVYALGATMAAVAAGEDATELPRKGLEVDLSAAIRPGTLRTVLQVMLRADPERRPSSAGQVRAVLARVDGGDGSLPMKMEDLPPSLASGEESPAEDGALQRWHRLSSRQRGMAIGYLWLAIGLGVATRAVLLVLALVLLFPLVLLVIQASGKRPD